MFLDFHSFYPLSKYFESSSGSGYSAVDHGRICIIEADGKLEEALSIFASRGLSVPVISPNQCSQQASPSGFGYGRTDLGFFWIRPDWPRLFQLRRGTDLGDLGDLQSFE